MMVGMDSSNPERYHLTLSSAGRPVMNGWWGSETVARSRFRDWIGKHGVLPGARITLVDEETGATLTTWPDEA
jgi:acyl-coenzyme A synthetase/AMP-(fatty) acid ligase